MFRWGFDQARGYMAGISRRWTASCEDGEENSLLAQADAQLEAQADTFKTPMSFDVLRMIMSPAGGHNNFDGLRITVTKLLNMNCQVMHQYILGSAMTGGAPVYSYRAVYGSEDSTLQVGSDFDFNSDGYARKQISTTGALVSKWGFRDGSNHIEFSYEGNDAASNYVFNYAPYTATANVSFMQAVTPSFAMGGALSANLDKRVGSLAFGALYERRDNTLAATYEEDSLSLMYTRRVNPNRVHLTSEFKHSAREGSQFAVGAEYTLKQAKLQFSLDNNVTLKSALESQVMPGVKLQLATELQHGTDQFKCGYGLSMGD